MPHKDKITIIVFSGEMDKALAAFNIAIGAASSGMDVTMFFTFWGLNIIKKNQGPIKSSGMMRKMLNIMNRGGSKRLPLSRFHMLGIGKWMMKRLMNNVNFPQAEELVCLLANDKIDFVQAERDAIGIGANAWQIGGLNCMRELRNMTIAIYKQTNQNKAFVDYISFWWDGIGSWRAPSLC